MRFTVSWRPEVQADLAEIWLNVANKSAVTAAANRIDQLLASDPSNEGEEIHEGLRGLIVEPLTVYYTVSEPDRLVVVWAVRQS